MLDRRRLSEERADEGEHCDNCGRLYLDVYSLPDAVWARIHERAPAGLLCPTCALDRVARFALPLLPEKCWHHPSVGIPAAANGAWACSVCRGSGWVWDPETENRIALAVRPLIDFLGDELPAARAVLAALNSPTPEEEQ